MLSELMYLFDSLLNADRWNVNYYKNHNILFQLEIITKGKKLVDIFHVRNVEEYGQKGRSFFIEAEMVGKDSVTFPA